LLGTPIIYIYCIIQFNESKAFIWMGNENFSGPDLSFEEKGALTGEVGRYASFASGRLDFD
jgi:hypothetical protein